MIQAEVKEFRKQTSGYMLAAFGLIAGLAWNDAVKSLIEYLFPLSESNLWLKFLYAIFITILVFIMGRYVFRVESEK